MHIQIACIQFVTYVNYPSTCWGLGQDVFQLILKSHKRSLDHAYKNPLSEVWGKNSEFIHLNLELIKISELLFSADVFYIYRWEVYNARNRYNLELNP